MSVPRNRCQSFVLFSALLAQSVASAAPAAEPAATLRAAVSELKAHVEGTRPLAAPQINQRRAAILDHAGLIGTTPERILQALDLSASYEAKLGPLFVNAATRKGFPRKPAGGLEIHRAIFALQQAIMDHVFKPENVRKHADLLDRVVFRTSEYFPGSVDPPSDPNAVHRVKINATQPLCWGVPVMYTKDPARRPTGCYLAPGSIGTVTVPPSLVGKGYSVRVGAHSWDLKKKPRVKRLDRVSLVFPIAEARTFIANPLGGGIYIEVPYRADGGIVDVAIANAVRSPFFSARSFAKTTLEQWQNTERHHPGPWADFESDKFMMQVPTKWIYAYDDPATLMRDWDTSLDVVSGLFGLPLVRSKTVLYLQTDVIYRGSANFPGYPQSNFRYNPYKPESGHSSHWLLKGPQSAGQTIFHELGHAQLFTKFRGEVEAVVNLPYVAVLNKGFGVDLDTAFGRSCGRPSISLDQAAIMWMVTENFREGRPMDISNSPANEVRYQHRGYGKYVEIVNLFGWKPLEDFWHSVHLDYLKGIEYPRNTDPTDNRILRLSRKAGVDLTPLIHFWGVQPHDSPALSKTMLEAGMKPSALIYDRLVRYKKLVPMSNEAFAEHAATVHPKGIREGKNPLFGEGWYFGWLPKYSKTHGEAAQKALQQIIDTYFPEGRPEP